MARPLCVGCGNPLRYENVSGYCRRCLHGSPGPAVPLTEARIGYLAGAFDCDGSLTIQPSSQRGSNGKIYTMHRAIAQIGLVDRAPIDFLAGVFPGTVQEIPAGRSGPNTLPQYRWHVSDARALALVDLIEPHLMIKGQQARILQELQATKNRYGRRGVPPAVLWHRANLMRQMRDLNQRVHLRQELWGEGDD